MVKELRKRKLFSVSSWNKDYCGNIGRNIGRKHR
jgi:hypothetical protein